MYTQTALTYTSKCICILRRQRRPKQIESKRPIIHNEYGIAFEYKAKYYKYCM